MKTHYDLIIIGAGPAGLSTALHLAHYAPHLVSHTLILEKARHPRPKICAGGLLPDGEYLLKNLGLDVRDLPHIDVPAAHLVFKGRGLLARPRRGALFRVIRRDAFDAWLAEKARQAGFTLLEETAVQRVISTESGLDVVTTQGVFHARAVVGADGSNGVTAKTMETFEQGQPVARLLEVITPAPQDRPQAWFDFTPVPQGISGYVWNFPSLMGPQAARCWGIYDANIHPAGQHPSLKPILAEAMSTEGLDLSAYPLKGHPIRLYTRHKRLSAPGLVLAGDAAGADPLLGEGISFALGYGRLAARALQEAFEQEDFSFNNYDAAVQRSALGRALQRRTFFARLLYSLPNHQAFIWQRAGGIVKFLGFVFVAGWAWRLKK